MLTTSLFIVMFGELIENPKGWKMKKWNEFLRWRNRGKYTLFWCRRFKNMVDRMRISQ